MRIGLQTWGSHGDIRPFLALAKGLKSSGHDVSLTITTVDDMDYSEPMLEEGINFSQVASPVIQNIAEYAEIGKLVLNEKNPIKQAKRILSKVFLPAEKEMFEANPSQTR